MSRPRIEVRIETNWGGDLVTRYIQHLLRPAERVCSIRFITIQRTKPRTENTSE